MSNPIEQLIKGLAPDKRALLAEYLRPRPEPIAVVGIGCRFPGAAGPEAFWELLAQGRDTISDVPADRWDAAAYYDPDPDAPDRMYTRWGGFLAEAALFDTHFFGLSPREALRMDPQQRLLLEVAWEALEDAGLQVAALARSKTGLFIGLMHNDYMLRQIYAEGVACLNDPYFMTGSSSNMASGRLAYLFDFQGPTVSLDTACSSSLVATHLAVQSLQRGECDQALVGGVNVVVMPDALVNLCKMRMLASDGRCKTFDAAGDGFVLGEGCGVLVLKRLSDARKSGDPIRAVIRGTAINEDGRSSSLTAPNGMAQQAVIRAALAAAGVKPEQISYVEAHGSGTALGDPIEMEALRTVLGAGRTPDRALLVGAVKTNIGHLGAAAGVAGLIKTVLALQHGQIPPHLNLKTLSPGIPREGAPFAVPAALTRWEGGGEPRRAGVSSFGWSGTNAHVIVEEAPAPPPPAAPARPWQLLVWSARTAGALDSATARLRDYLAGQPQASLAEVAHTLQTGRNAFAHRRALVARDLDDARAALAAERPERIATGQAGEPPALAWLFPGVGDHYAGMARELYDHEPVFRAAVEQCCAILAPLLGQDLAAALYPPAQPDAPAGPAPLDLKALLGRAEGPTGAEAGPLHQTALAQPAVFVVAYALAQLLLSWGLRPQAMLGYSLGEYVAATLAGVLRLEDALTLVATRARLIQALPHGAMLAVALGEAEVQPLLSATVNLAAVNSPGTCVLAGPRAALAEVAQQLAAQGVACRWLETSHAFHSAMLAPVAEELTALAATLPLQPPQIPYISNVTGTWITPEQATDPAYWAEHMCAPVRFAEGAGALLAERERALLEVGPGAALGSFVRQHPDCTRERLGRVLSTLPAAHERQSAQATLLGALGRLWASGAPIDWAALAGPAPQRRVSLPTYPFEHQRYWIDLAGQTPRLPQAAPSAGKRSNIADWFYRPVWAASSLPALAPLPEGRDTWLIFADAGGLGAQLAERLERSGRRALLVRQGERFAQLDQRSFVLDPLARADYARLIERVAGQLSGSVGVAHLWSVDPLDGAGPAAFELAQQRGFYSLVWLAQALERQRLDATVDLVVCASGLQHVVGDEPLAPERATLLGLATVIPQELQGIACRTIDLAPPAPDTPAEPELLDLLVRDLLTPATARDTAYRGGQRWTLSYAPVRLAEPGALREGGVYLITGGLGAIGLQLAEHLAARARARLVLVGRSGLPARETWAAWLAEHADDDSTSRRIAAVRQLEARGAEVLVAAADVASAPALRAAVELAEQRFGRIDGVIHAAGVVSQSAFRAITAIDGADCAAHFAPKVHGLYALEQALDGRQPDFCLLFSSLSAVLGGLSFGAYAAANSFMDAFASARSGATRWVSVNWDLWQGTLDQEGAPGAGASLLAYSMTAAEGCAAFERALGPHGLAHLVQSTGDLEARIRQWVRLETPAAQTGALALARPELATAFVAPQGEYERRIAAVWGQVLGLEQVGIHDNFFDLGGNSLVAVQVIAALKQEFQVQLATVALFEAPTVSALANYVYERLPQAAPAAPQPARIARRRPAAAVDGGIAIIGMAGRFPGAATLDVFWQNLRDGVEALTHFSDEQLLAAGVSAELLANPEYVKARPVLTEDVGLFDAAFFGYTPREAEFMDPQQRLFHECAWEALERAGYDTQRYPGLVGVFAGASLSTYMLQLATHPVFRNLGSDMAAIFSNDKDGLTTNVSYKLNLRGPSMAVQTYCSTSLVATHLACRSLRNGECDMALAGGVSIRVPSTTGYLYREGDQVSPDGHCRTFDVCAGGANFGDGVALVVLKRLDDALADGDTIHAVIRGSAVNNDGVRKVGYTAPSVVGQAEAVELALADAGLAPDAISYIEAHGTATRLGDPIEIASLTRAFRSGTDAVGACAISSTKPNVGHLDRAAGVTGLIKTVLALQHELIPPTLHFTAPNPEIDFASSPFYVTTAPTPWPRTATPRRAGVNSLGVGGTNAHVVVEEAPVQPPSGPSRAQQLLLLSARTPTALEAATANLARFLRDQPEVDLADVAHTLQVGRRVFEHRRALVCTDVADALQALEGGDARRLLTAQQRPASRPVAFLFPGVGDHYVGMAQQLYESEPTFRATVDRCCALLERALGRDLAQVLYPAAAEAPDNGHAPALDFKALLGRGTGANGSTGAAASPLHQTALAQPAVFVVEYALAQLLAEWGIRPQAMLGYSLGEYVAATLAGVLTLDDALTLVATRARLIQALPHGAMLAVALGEAEVQPFLSNAVNLAVVTGPRACVLAGPHAALEPVAQQLAVQEVACRWLETSHAFHSSMLAPIAEELTALAATLPLRPPQIPYLSNVTGDWITAEQATDPAYWAQHMCAPVRFAEGVGALLAQAEQVLVEVGPGAALGSFVRQHPECGRERLGQVLATLPGAHERTGALSSLLTALGRLWLLDVPLDWAAFAQREQRRRIPLPTYPFERQRFWIEPSRDVRPGAAGPPVRRPEIADWFTAPSWKRTPTLTPFAGVEPARRCWVVLADACGVGQQLGAWLADRDQEVVLVTPGGGFARSGAGSFSVRPAARADYEALFQDLGQRGLEPQQVLHCWMVTPPQPEDELAALPDLLERGFYSLLALTQALGERGVEQCCVTVLSNDMQEVSGREQLCAAKATLNGPVRVIPQEYPNLRARSIDLELAGGQADTALVGLLAAEVTARSDDDIVALRGGHRWVQCLEPLPIGAPDAAATRLRAGGVYMITGGLGGIGLDMAEHLAATRQARLALVGRSPLPPRAAWDAWLADHADDDRTSQRIRRVQAIEALGGEVLVLQADVADAGQIAAAVQQTQARFGALHGVLHTAGVPGVGMMQLKEASAAAGTLAPKVQGTLALARALRDVPLDFLVLFSSITSVTSGGPGQVDYCAANAFLDAFALRHHRAHGVTLAIGWGEWLWDAWSEGLAGFTEEMRAAFRTIRRVYGIRPDEGAAALERILARGVPHVFVTPQDLLPMVESSRSSAAAAARAQYWEEQQSRPLYPRPTLGTSYAAPRNPTESTIAAAWGTVLGIEQIGVDDNFFDLGGNSLLGIDLIARLRRALKLDKLPAYVLYEAPTVAAMAEYIAAQAQPEPAAEEQPEASAEKRQDRLNYFKRKAQVEDIV